jgi:hypothetical protein
MKGDIQMIKIPYEQVKSFIEIESDSGCKLLTPKDEYKGTSKSINLLCKCGKEFKTTYGNFVSSNKRRCEICAHKIQWNYYSVKNYIEVESNSGCKLITEEIDYKNTRQKLLILCGCGEYTFSTSFENFKGKTKHKQYCYKCGRIKWTYEKAKTFVSEFGCELLTQEQDYYNGSSWVDIKCSCGNTFTIRFYNFKTGIKQCTECTNIKRFTYQEVKNYIESYGYKLISKFYKINTTELILECPKGHIFKTTFANFKNNGNRCPICQESRGEQSIRDYLINNNIFFISQYKFNNCKDKRSLPFDFALFKDEEKAKLMLLIEFDGRQHYEWIKGWITKKSFETLQIHDQLKNEYCKKHNIKLLRIPYWDYDNIEQILCQELNLKEAS